jgi:2-oxoglutarate ferredoxin oxidoreductase subunit delta
MAKKRCTVVVRKDFCKGCDLCIAYCKHGVLESSENLNAQGYHYAQHVEGKECAGCMVCTLVCPEVAIEVFSE